MATEIHLGTSAGNKVLTQVQLGTSAGNKALTEIWVGTSAGNKQVFSYTAPASCSPNSGTINLVYPTLSGTTVNSTVTFSGGGTRTISFTNTALGTVTWRKNAGSYTTAALTMSSGDYFNFRFASTGGDEAASMEVYDSVAPTISIYTLSVSMTGSL